MGAELASQGLDLVYGGASRGLMGAVADAALLKGARVTGVITKELVASEVAHTGLSSLEVVDTMHDRKARMAELSDAFVMLPGGFGTLEEFIEAVSWAQLGIHTKPCGLLNVNGFFNPLLAFIERAVAECFLRAEHAEMIQVADSPAELVRALRASLPVALDKRIDDPPSPRSAG